MTTPEESGPAPGPHEAYLTATAAANEMLQTADTRLQTSAPQPLCMRNSRRRMP